MGDPHIEVPAGAVDGFNQIFTLLLPYAPGTTAVFLNGVLQRQNFVDGWVETSPLLGIVTLNIAPEVGDTVQVYFIDGLAPTNQVCEVVSALFGKINSSIPLVGVLSTSQTLHGLLRTCDG